MIEGQRALRHQVGNESQGQATIKDGDTQVQGKEVTLPTSHSQQMLEPGQLPEPVISPNQMPRTLPRPANFGP